MKTFEDWWDEGWRCVGDADPMSWARLGWEGYKEEAQSAAVPCEAEDGEHYTCEPVTAALTENEA